MSDSPWAKKKSESRLNSLGTSQVDQQGLGRDEGEDSSPAEVVEDETRWDDDGRRRVTLADAGSGRRNPSQTQQQHQQQLQQQDMVKRASAPSAAVTATTMAAKSATSTAASRGYRSSVYSDGVDQEDSPSNEALSAEDREALNRIFPHNSHSIR